MLIVDVPLYEGESLQYAGNPIPTKYCRYLFQHRAVPQSDVGNLLQHGTAATNIHLALSSSVQRPFRRK